MTADGLPPCVARPSATMVLTVYDQQVLVFYEEPPPPASSQLLRNDSTNKYVFDLCCRKEFQYHMGW